ncbi:MAG: hypothetical protein KAQ83_01350 [Nanoarchaeota archaeon]|nr:hypothetical protein [Nanoarchaeota archaeon]
MINFTILENYFPVINKDIIIGNYTFYIKLYQDKNGYFSLEVDISKKDTKEKHRFVQFLLGLGKDEPNELSCHDSEVPHFKIDYYQREEEAFSATIYFTFRNIAEEELIDYAKGTVVIITKMLRKYFENEDIDIANLSEVVYENSVISELLDYEEKVIDAFYICWKEGDLIVRQKGKDNFVIKTKHNLIKYLNFDYLKPIYLPLKEKIEINEKINSSSQIM